MSIISESNEQQKKAIIHSGGPQLIVAGAGTGKTRVITSRMAWLITEKDFKSDQVLALTFTEKAAQEMSERVETMLPYGYVDLWISTFHSFCDKVLKWHGLDIGLPDDFKLLDETEAWLLIRKNLDRFNLDYYRPLGNPAKFIHALLKHFSRCKDEGISAADYLRYAEEIKLNSDAAEFIKEIDLSELTADQKKELMRSEILRVREVADAYHLYQQILLDNDSLDFADLILRTIELFKKRPAVLEKFRQQFKEILVDEFQDTNFVQYELIKLLAAPKNNLTVVGDDDQSIYKFRGASISNIMQFKEDFPGAAEVVLADNYRSRQKILDLSYEFIVQNNPFRLEEKLGINKKLKSHVEGEAEILHLHEETGEEEAAAVVKKILALWRDGRVSWSNFAILARANDSAGIFVNELERAGIPYQFMARRGLYNKPEVIDLLNYFKLLDNYHEGPAAYRVLNFDFLGLAADQIAKLSHFAKKKSVSLFEVMKQSAALPGIAANSLAVLNKIIVQIEKGSQLAKNKKPSEVMLDFLYHSGYLEYIQKLSPARSKESLGIIQQFFKKIQTFENSMAEPRIRDFLELIKMEMEAGESGRLGFDAEEGPDLVKIMTVHSAKGLEFDYVFVVNMVDRKFPTDERREAIEIPDALIREKIPAGDFHLQEERRLFYVAMTRAKKGLYLTSAEDYGGARKKKLSRFLAELNFTLPEESSRQKADELILPPKIFAAEKSVIYELPKKFSYSQMRNYEECPWRYRFANVLKIPTFGNHYFTFGTVIHSTLQKFLAANSLLENNNQQSLFGRGSQDKKTAGLDRLLEIYNQCWSDDWYLNVRQKQDYFKKGEMILKKFYDRFIEEKPSVKGLEQSFNVKIGEYFFSGRIDRIDEAADNKVRIIDYKTGEGKGDSLSAEDKRQLILYQIAAEDEKVLNLKVESLSYYYLEDDKVVPFIAKPEEKEKLKQRFSDNIEQIKEQNFAPTPSEHVCRYCDYRDICEFKKL